MFKGYAPLALQNPFSRFRYLFDADRKDLKWEVELDEFVKYLCQLNKQHPIQLLEVAKDSHCLDFNRLLHQVRSGHFQNNYIITRNSLYSSEESGWQSDLKYLY
jgi:hypothetical protein